MGETMKCEIEIDLGPLAEEWEPVAFRKPVKGEPCVGQCGNNVFVAVDFIASVHLIVRRKWHWPEWLTAEWYFEGHDGEQYVSDGLPCVNGDVVQMWSAKNMRRITGITTLQKIGGDWRQSKRRNPRSKS